MTYINCLLKNEFDYAALMKSVTLAAEKYPILQFSYLTESVMGKGIPLLKIGSGEKRIFYIGAHHGAERITSAILMKFTDDFCSAAKSSQTVFGMNTEYLLKSRTLYIIPMLNPDGVDISANGPPLGSLWYTRIATMNGSDNFSNWQANANGIDLNHNYDADFSEYKEVEASLGIKGGCASRYAGEKPESEPESGALANYLRFNMPHALVTLHTQGQEIYYKSGGICPRESKIAALKLARLTGYKLANPKGAASYSGLTDFCIKKLCVPAFTIECGKGRNPLPPKDFPIIYATLKEALFSFPSMF